MATYSKDAIPVMEDAKKLCAHTLRLTNNLNNFPKKYRYTLVDRLVRTSFDIHDGISDANLSRGEERIKFQTETIKSCRKMKFYLQCVYEVLKPSCNIVHWTGIVDRIENQVVKWRASTKIK